MQSYVMTRSRAQQMYINAFNKAREIFFESSICEEGSSGLSHPFFQSNPEDSTFNVEEVIRRNCSKEHFKAVNEVFQDINVPKHLIFLYYWLESVSREFNYANMTWMSIDSIRERIAAYKDGGQDRIIDLAYQYAGMGWIDVLSLDRKSGKFFFRIDGGSNGYDRKFNWETACNIDPSKMTKDKLLTFDEAISKATFPRDSLFISEPE